MVNSNWGALEAQRDTFFRFYRCANPSCSGCVIGYVVVSSDWDALEAQRDTFFRFYRSFRDPQHSCSGCASRDVVTGCTEGGCMQALKPHVILPFV